MSGFLLWWQYRACRKLHHYLSCPSATTSRAYQKQQWCNEWMQVRSMYVGYSIARNAVLLSMYMSYAVRYGNFTIEEYLIYWFHSLDIIKTGLKIQQQQLDKEFPRLRTKQHDDEWIEANKIIIIRLTSGILEVLSCSSTNRWWEESWHLPIQWVDFTAFSWALSDQGVLTPWSDLPM